MPLVKRFRSPDGGISDGLGSLSAYRNHIATHSEHSKSRDSRMKGQHPKTPPIVKKEQMRVLDAMDKSFGSPSPSQHTSTPTNAKYNLIKSEPMEVKPAAPISMSDHDVSRMVGVSTPAHRKTGPASIKSEVSEPQSLHRKRFSTADNLEAERDNPCTPEVKRRKLEEIPVNLGRKPPTLLKRAVMVTPHKENNYTNAPTAATQVPIQPLSSGSKLQLRAYVDVDDDDDMDVDYNQLNDDLAVDVLRRVGDAIPQIAPLRGSENFDENGNFHGRGRDTFVGPRADADDIDKFLIEAGNAAQFDGNAKIEQALEKLGLRTQYDLLPGMEVALMPHQTIGVAWMVEKEKSKLKGGCLADDMGLGKTVQMIATMVKNRSSDPKCKTNLIITPTALLDQWKMEIELKTNCNFDCLIYHGLTKPRRKQDLLKYDVILTTYSTMSLEWPDYENEMKKAAKAKKGKKKDDFIVDDSSDDTLSRKPKKKPEQGLLFQTEFYRIILDESQAIRNKRTRTSRAVTSLQSVYRWCLTGTPIINGLSDAYGSLRFLRIRPWYDPDEFQRHIGRLEKKRPDLAVTRLQAIFETFLLRRLKNTEMDGKRLIELPDKTVSLIKLQFSEEERDIYKMVEAGAQANFNRFLRAGTVLKNYTQVLVLLLRLRQICSHPSLIQEGGEAFISPDEADEAGEVGKELARARRLVSGEFVEKMKTKFKTTALQRMEAEKQSVDATVEDEECPICFDALTDAVVTPCGHVFCRELDVLHTPRVVMPDEPDKFKPNERPCPSCREAICAEKLFSRVAFLPSDADLLPDEDITEENAGGRKAKRKNKSSSLSDSEWEDDDDDMSDFIVEDDEDEEEEAVRRTLKKSLGRRKAMIIIDSDDEETPEEKEVIFGKAVPRTAENIKLMPKFLPSTKMKARLRLIIYMMQQLDNLFKDRPDEKVIIVSQWTGCLSLVSDYLTEKGVIHVKYQGDMIRAKRAQAVHVFMSKDKARVMLMSLKCGGKLSANNVISLDLGWSQAIEAQSFDRYVLSGIELDGLNMAKSEFTDWAKLARSMSSVL
ncbi:hypothetical protein H0H93_002233 [Arthromyces matolae]|nr:hypothetical protein H0H93_002233 [Arthromyces matolae]